MTNVKINIADILEAELGSHAHVPASVEISDLLEFNDLYECEQDLDDLLDEQLMVALVWTIDDVQTRRPDLTPEQAWEILKRAKNQYEADAWHLDFIQATADGLYPKKREARPAKLAQLIADYDPNGDERENLIDLLTDTMHWCEGFGEPFDEFYSTALSHFARELNASETEA